MASVREASSPSPPPVDPLSPRAIRPEDAAPAREGTALDEDGLPPNPAQLRSPPARHAAQFRACYKGVVEAYRCAATTPLLVWAGWADAASLGSPSQRAPRELFCVETTPQNSRALCPHVATHT